MFKKKCSKNKNKELDSREDMLYSSQLRKSSLVMQIEADEYYEQNIENDSQSSTSNVSDDDEAIKENEELDKEEQKEKEKEEIYKKKNKKDQKDREETEESYRRSRQRSYDNEDQDQSQRELQFSVSGKNPLQKKAVARQRNMNDIKNDSLHTSYHIKNESFKWSRSLKYPINTYKKGMILRDKQPIKRINQENQILKKDKTLYKNAGIVYDLNIISQMFESHEHFVDIQYSFFLQSDKIQLTKKDYSQRSQDMKYFQQLDKGSFGKVDLYFMELDQNSIQVQQQNLLLSSNNINNSYSTQASNEKMNNSGQQSSVLHNILSINQSIEYKDNFLSGSNQSQSIQLESQISQNSDLDVKQSQLEKSKKLIPVAGKQINVQSEFIRELYIMETVKNKYIPKLLSYDVENQILFMELGLCSLYDLKMESIQNKQELSDDFTYSILINLFHAVESLLQNYNMQDQKQQPLFHSDIKPQNIVLTLKKINLIEVKTKLLLIDYGGASFQLDDYWSYYTPAFVCNHLWQQLVNSNNKWDHLTWSQVRYGEIYAACRSVQFLLLDDLKSHLFYKENSQQFIEKYCQRYPKTCRILENVFIKNKSFQIFSDYKNILQEEEIWGNNILESQPINFDEEKLFQISKFYKILNQE